MPSQIAKKKKVFRRRKNVRKPKYKGAAGSTFQAAYNNEIYQYELPPQSADFGAIAAVAGTQSKNTKVFLGALYNRNTTAMTSNNTQPRGTYLTPKFYTDKYRISFADIVPDHADSAAGFLLRMHVVQVKITPSKASIRTDSLANWSADIEALVNKELALSNIQSDHLEFSQKNRNVKVVRTQLIKPNRNGMIRLNIQPGTVGENYSCPSPVCLTVKHQVPNFKQRLSGTISAVPMLTDMWIGAVCFESNNLTLNTGSFKIEHSSKFYYTD
jgi:hypothetical protein